MISKLLFLSGGNLNNGTNAGSAYLNLNNGVGNANWNICARNFVNSFVGFVLQYMESYRNKELTLLFTCDRSDCSLPPKGVRIA